MSRRADKNKAIKLRQKGYSYSQIKEELGISKSTLSGWLKDMPLPKERLDELQRNEKVIEKIREAKRKTRDQRLATVYTKVSNDIGSLSPREFLIAGFFLYWAEGSKTQRYVTSLSNTDPKMIRAFISWLHLLGVPNTKITIRLHLYSDMNVAKEISYWSKELGLAAKQFGNPYIKKSKLTDLTYITRGHGTCNATVSSRDVAEYVHQGLKRISEFY